MPDELHELIHQLMYEPNDPGEIHSCPNCGGVLHVRFLALPTSDISNMPKLEVNSSCEKCRNNVFTLYELMDDLPEWIKQKKSDSPGRYGELRKN